MTDGTAERPAPDPSTADLVRQASEQISRLVRDELALARAGRTYKGRQAGIGAGVCGGGGLVALYGAAAVLAAVVLLLAGVGLPWLAALIVGVVLRGGAGLGAMLGRSRGGEAVPPVPEQAVRS